MQAVTGSACFIVSAVFYIFFGTYLFFYVLAHWIALCDFM